MIYKYIYKTPKEFSDMIMISDGEYLLELYFENGKNGKKQNKIYEEKELTIFKETSEWLDKYFCGEIPDFTPKYKIQDLTPFRKEVIDIMNTIDFGKTMTYGDIAKRIAANRGTTRVSAQAVGGAVGWNPICIIIPCHRVVGTNGKLVGYGGGIDNKAELLIHEGHCVQKSK